MKQDAFTATPPKVTIGGEQKQLRALAPLSWPRVQKAQELVEGYGDTALVLGYILTHSVPPAEVAALTDDDDAYRASLDALALEATMEDLQSVADYIAAVIERLEASQVETPEGKA